MKLEFDNRDAEILVERERAYNEIKGPRVGDFLKAGDGDFLKAGDGLFLRFTHDWDEDIQTTVGPKHPCHGDASFYLSDGHVSFSGSLDRAIPKSQLRDTGEKLNGSFWFFHHNYAGAGRGVYFKMACRVFERIDLS